MGGVVLGMARMVFLAACAPKTETDPRTISREGVVKLAS